MCLHSVSDDNKDVYNNIHIAKSQHHVRRLQNQGRQRNNISRQPWDGELAH